MAADVIPALTVLRGSENVKPCLEPVIEAVSDLNGFVQLMVRRQGAVIGGFGALKGEIGMEFNHGVARLDRFVGIHLDFVVLLSAGGQSQGHVSEQAKRNQECSLQSHIQSLTAPQGISTFRIGKLG